MSGSLLPDSVLTHDEGEIGLAEADDGDKEEDDEDGEEKVEWRIGAEDASEGFDEMAVETQDDDCAKGDIGDETPTKIIEQLGQEIDECGACHAAEEEQQEVVAISTNDHEDILVMMSTQEDQKQRNDDPADGIFIRLICGDLFFPVPQTITYDEKGIGHEGVGDGPNELGWVQTEQRDIVVVVHIGEHSKCHEPQEMQIGSGGELKYNLENDERIDEP